MTRRELIFLLGGALTPARALRAQQRAMPMIGSVAGMLPDDEHDRRRNR